MTGVLSDELSLHFLAALRAELAVLASRDHS
jgi:hypothetical protein